MLPIRRAAPTRSPLAEVSLAALLLVALAAVGCQGSRADRTGQKSAGFHVADFEILWDVARREMGRNGYVPDSEASSREGKVMTSRWNTQLAPFSGRGQREQATLTFVPVPDQPNRWTVEANVIRQVNKQIKEPMNIVKAEWTDGDRVPEKEGQLVYGIESFFLGHDVSDKFRSSHGMPAR